MSPALLDECLDLALVPALRERGFDVLSLLTIGPRGIADPAVLERAFELGRVLITQNADDFRAVHAAFLRQGQVHAGIICLPQRGSFRRRALRAAMMLDWIASQEYASRSSFGASCNSYSSVASGSLATERRCSKHSVEHS